MTCIICGEEPKLWGELGKNCAEKFEIRDEASFRASYPVLLRIGYGVMEILGNNMRNHDVRPVDKSKWFQGVALSPTVGDIVTPCNSLSLSTGRTSLFRMFSPSVRRTPYPTPRMIG